MYERQFGVRDYINPDFLTPPRYNYFSSSRGQVIWISNTKIIRHQNSLSVRKEKDISINLFFYSKIFSDTNILQQSNLSFKAPLTFMLLHSDSSPSAPADVPSTPEWQAPFVLQTLQYYFLIPRPFLSRTSFFQIQVISNTLFP